VGYVRAGVLRKLGEGISGEDMKNNKGFTLIELLVVIALIAVSIGVVGISASNSARDSLRKCANAADSMLSRVRINSMYRADPVFAEFDRAGGNIVARYFESDADGNYQMVEEQILGRADRITVTPVIDGNESSLPIKISFTRRGKLVLLEEEGTLDGIQFSLGEDGLTYVIDITPSTGNRQVRVGRLS